MSIRKGATEAVHASRRHAIGWLRRSFFTGIVVGAPIGITIWLIWSFVSFVDRRIKPLIPPQWNPETYLQFALPGLGIVVAVVAITLVGALTTNFLGRTLLGFGEQILNRVPLISPIYFALKQVFETFAKSEGSSFKEAVLVPFPHANSWSVGFVTNRHPGGVIAQRIVDPVAVLIPHVPNPASGLLVYVPAVDVVPLDMPIDQALKLVISFGILTPEQLAGNGGAINKPESAAAVKPPPS
jgi:uncharacterized membrane protein